MARGAVQGGTELRWDSSTPLLPSGHGAAVGLHGATCLSGTAVPGHVCTLLAVALALSVHTDCVSVASRQGCATAGCTIRWESAAFKLSELQWLQVVQTCHSGSWQPGPRAPLPVAGSGQTPGTWPCPPPPRPFPTAALQLPSAGCSSAVCCALPFHAGLYPTLVPPLIPSRALGCAAMAGADSSPRPPQPSAQRCRSAVPLLLLFCANAARALL